MKNLTKNNSALSIFSLVFFFLLSSLLPYLKQNVMFSNYTKNPLIYLYA